MVFIKHNSKKMMATVGSQQIPAVANVAINCHRLPTIANSQ
jgi:hypothetical protein